MRAVLIALATSMVALLRSRASLHLEILALRNQLAVLQDGGRRPRPKAADRLLWVWLWQVWSGWQNVPVFVKPSTIVSWQRKRFRDHWTRLSQRGKPAQPPIAQEMSSSPGQSPTPGPLQIRTRRFPPSGSSADAAHGYGPQIRTVIRGRGSGKSRSRSTNRSQVRRLRWLRRQSHLYQARFAASTSNSKLRKLPLTPK
jgi:hypothetical protein